MTIVVAAVAFLQGNAPLPLRVNVAARQEFDYDLTLPGAARPYRLLYTVDRASRRGRTITYAWRVRQYERDEAGRAAASPVYESVFEADDRNNPTKPPSGPLVDHASFGASERAKAIARLALANLTVAYPTNPLHPDKVWQRKLPNPLVKGETYSVDYRKVGETTVKSWSCEAIHFAANVPVGYGGKEIAIEGDALVERSTGMAVTVDFRVMGADSASENVNRDFHVHLTRDREG